MSLKEELREILDPVIDDFVQEDERISVVDQLLTTISKHLPEKKEAKAPYDILELEKAFQNGRSQAIDEVNKLLKGE